MLYQYLVDWSENFSVLNVFRYITFRSFISFFTAFFFGWFWGPKFIALIKKKQYGQSIRQEGPEGHKKKEGTPTLGGGLIFISFLAPCLLWMDLMNPLVGSVLFLTLGFASIGFIDDYLKVSKKNSKGLSGKVRLFGEFALSIGVLFYLVRSGYMGTDMHVPFFKHIIFDLGWFYILFGSLVIVGCANAVNLTDGLDGLAIVPVIVSVSTSMIFAYVTGHHELAQYLGIQYVSGAGELVPLAAALIGSGLAFLWFNAYPAQIFMGDVGSLGLGGFLGILAVITNNELLLVILGGVFVVEALSVITQVASFKLRGKRIFKMAPIHHHFELKGLVENKIIVRFWIVSLLLAVLSLSTLKLR